VKPIVIHDQVRLSAARCLYLTLAGMYYRLTRSAITITIVALAVAFLAYMLSYSVFVQERVHAAHQELRQSRLLGEWVARLSAPDPLPDIVAAMVNNTPERMVEYRRWSGVGSDSALAALRPAFVSYQAFLDYLEGMRPASRAVLLGDVDPYQLPALLCNADYLAVFVRQLAELSLKPPLGGEAALRSFLANDWPAVVRLAALLHQGQQAAVDSIRVAAGERSVVRWIADDPDAVAGLAEGLGYAPMQRLSETLRRQARESGEERALTKLLGMPQIVAGTARLLDVDRKKVDMAALTGWMRTAARAEAFRAVATAVVPAGEVPPAAQLVAVAGRYQRTARLQLAPGAEDAVAVKRGLAGVPQATRWLIIVSFLVCAVGICNTMFMSVTERFTEIATMKCLGAMDGFVMLMFVFEAAIQGVAGSLVGIVVGFALAALRGLAGYGAMFFESVPWGSLAMVAGGAVFVGIVLAAVSAVSPAWMAARLAPMEAMRVE
jgi:hypothetical protein